MPGCLRALVHLCSTCAGPRMYGSQLPGLAADCSSCSCSSHVRSWFVATWTVRSRCSKKRYKTSRTSDNPTHLKLNNVFPIFPLIFCAEWDFFTVISSNNNLVAKFCCVQNMSQPGFIKPCAKSWPTANGHACIVWLSPVLLGCRSQLRQYKHCGNINHSDVAVNLWNSL